MARKERVAMQSSANRRGFLKSTMTAAGAAAFVGALEVHPAAAAASKGLLADARDFGVKGDV